MLNSNTLRKVKDILKYPQEIIERRSQWYRKGNMVIR